MSMRPRSHGSTYPSGGGWEVCFSWILQRPDLPDCSAHEVLGFVADGTAVDCKRASMRSGPAVSESFILVAQQGRWPSKEKAMVRVLAICMGGALGTGARYLLSSWMLRTLGPAFPVGTLFVNLSGSFL